MKTATIFISLLLALSANAQTTFSRADSLRGSLRPERTNFDVTYYHLTVDVNPTTKDILGSVEIVLIPALDLAVQRIQLDLFKNMNVTRIVDEQGAELKFDREENTIWVNKESPVEKGKPFTLTVDYGGKPIAAKQAPWDGGFDWKKDKNGNPWVGVAVEGIGASLWWPNKDHLSDEPDSMRISLIVPDGLVGVSNGSLESQELLGKKIKYNWKVSYPINNYNVSIYIGKYVHFADVFQGVEGPFDLDYYVLDYNLDKAKKQFEEVKPMFECYEKFLGPYPFPKDGFALVETPYLGMEHQSAIAYGNQYKTGYLGRDQSTLGLTFDYIIIHETGHEYWGNSVSMKDLADMWIHEGFCTYSEALYVECLHGPDTALLYANSWKFRVRNDQPVIGQYGVNNEGSGDMYYKGALMLHTLRWAVNNDSLWFELIKGIQRDFRFKTTDSDEIIAYMNKFLGKDYTPVFNQYLKKSKPPILSYSTKKKGKKLQLEIQWTNVEPGFELPLIVQLGKGRQETIQVTANEQTILFENATQEDFKVDNQHAYYFLAPPESKKKR